MSTATPWDHLIPMSEVLSLYAEGIKRYGGQGSPPKPGCLEQSCGNAYSAELYTESESVSGLAFSGYLLFYLARDHCFIDGNKRIAWLCSMRVLASLGLSVDVSQEDAEGVCKRIADSTLEDSINDGAIVVAWIAEHLVAVED
jgi:death on curing protein